MTVMGASRWRSAERSRRGRRDELRFDLVTGELELLEEAEAGEVDRLVSVRLTPAERRALAEAVRTYRTTARGVGESARKRELVLEDAAVVGVHATEGHVSIHLGRDPAELVVMYVHLTSLDAGAFVRALEAQPDT